jgi:hypothetical protein
LPSAATLAQLLDIIPGASGTAIGSTLQSCLYSNPITSRKVATGCTTLFVADASGLRRLSDPANISFIVVSGLLKNIGEAFVEAELVMALARD